MKLTEWLPQAPERRTVKKSWQQGAAVSCQGRRDCPYDMWVRIFRR